MNFFSQYSLIRDWLLDHETSCASDTDQSVPDDDTAKRPVVGLIRQHATQFITLEQIFSQWQ